MSRFGSSLSLLLPACALLLCAAAAVKPGFDPAQYSEIRVVLSDSKTYAELGGQLSWSVKGKSLGNTSAVVGLKLVDESSVKVTLGKKGVSGARIIAMPVKGYVRFGGRDYRGRMEIFPSRDGDTLVVLNVLPLEDYLLGVVPAEMPPAWPADALKAQAVAARSYALWEMRDRRQPDRDGNLSSFDVYPDTSDQVYKGVDGEDPRATKAVRDTAGVVLTWQGQPIFAQFCADCGGCTKCGSQPYLQAVPSYAPDSPHNDWSLSLSADKLASLVRAAGGGNIGAVRSIRAENDPHSGHLVKLTCSGDAGSFSIGGNRLRELLGLSTMKSTRAYVTGPGGASLEPQKETPVLNGAAGASPQGRTKEKALPQEAVDVQAQPADADSSAGFLPDAPAGDLGNTSAGAPPAGQDAAQQIRQAADSLLSYEVNAPSLGQLAEASRPTVLYRGGVADVKLRSIFVYDGHSLHRTPPEVSAVAMASVTEEQAVAAADNAGAEDLAGQGQPRLRPAVDPPAQPGADTESLDPPRQPQVKRQPVVEISHPQPKFSLPKQAQSEIPPVTQLKVGKGGIELHGSGYGHGVGLSQWGAKELAQEGMDYLSILLHFYTGVEVLTIPAGSASQPQAVCEDVDGSQSNGESVDVGAASFQRPKLPGRGKG